MATRRERVVLELEDKFTGELARAAVAARLLQRELDGFNSKTGPGFSRTAVTIERDSKNVASSIDRLSGRLALLVQAGTALAPAFVPLTTAVTPALAGLTTQLGFTVAAAGATVLAFQNVGDALNAFKAYSLDPTDANLDKINDTMGLLSPTAQEFVLTLRDMVPQFRAVREAASEGLFPGLLDSLTSVESLLPRFADIVGEISSAMGDIADRSAESLAGEEWVDFFDFVEREARPTMIQLAQSIGNVATGLAEMWMAFDPLSDDFQAGLVRATQAFEDWASGLSESEQFAEFIAYIRETGPQALSTIGSLADMFLEVAEAAAPLGGPVLQAIEAVADAIATIAESPLGTPLFAAASAMSALNLATTAFGKVSATSWATAIKGAEGYAARTAAIRQGAVVAAGGIAALSLHAQQSATGFDASNAAIGAMAGSLAGPWGLAVGAGVGALFDLADAADETTGTIDDMSEAISVGNVQAIKEQLAALREQRQEMYDFDTTGEKFKQVFKDVLDQVRGGETDFDELTTAIREGEDALDLFEDKGRDVGDFLVPVLAESLGIAAGKADLLVDSTSELTRQMTQLDRVLSKRAALRDFEAAIDAVTEAVEENGKTLNTNTEKGQQNQAALDALVRAAGEAADKLKGIDRVEFLERARAAIIDAATDFGMTNAEAEKFVNRFKILRQLVEEGVTGKADLDTSEFDKKTLRLLEQAGLLDTYVATPEVDAKTEESQRRLEEAEELLKKLGYMNPRPKIIAETAAALAELDRLQARINAVTQNRRFTVHADILTSHSAVGADGMTVPGPRAPYGDKIHTLLAPGEEVISNRFGQADRWRPLLKEINANRMAGGGTVGYASHSVPLSPPGVDYDRLAFAVAGHMRPMWGDVTIQAHDMSDIRREFARDRALAQSDGWSR